MKKCPPGEYYCNDSKKCKKIPSGYHVGARGYLTKDDDENGRKNSSSYEDCKIQMRLHEERFINMEAI